MIRHEGWEIIDEGGTLDFSCEKEDAPFSSGLIAFCWIPEENMRLRVRRDHVPYDVWAMEGCLQTTEGNVIHCGFIERSLKGSA